MRQPKLYTLMSLVLLLAFVLGACGGGATTTQAPAPTTAATDVPAATEAMTEEPAATEAMTEEPAATEAMTEEPAATEAMTEEPAATEAMTEEPAAACTDPKYTMGVSNSFIGSEWRAQMIKNMEDAAQELCVELVIESADTDVQGQIQQINNLVNRGVDAIIINPGDVQGLNAALEDAVAQGIVVIAVDQEIAAEGVYNAVIDQKEWAKISMEWLAEKLGGEGDVTLIEGFVGHPANEARMAGVQEVLDANPGLNVVGRDTGQWDPATAQRVAANFLASLPNIDGMWTQDGMAEGQLLALKAANPAEWPIVVGEARASFLRTWTETLAERPDFETIGVVNPPGVGADGVRIAYLLLEGRQIDESKLGGQFGNSLYVPIPEVITNENLAEYVAEIEGLPDSYTLDGLITQEEAEGFFLP